MNRFGRQCRVVLSSTLLATMAVAAGGCEAPSDEEHETSEKVSVKVEAARQGTIRDSVRVLGTVTPAPGAELLVTAPVSSRIGELPGSAGDPVRKGDLLVRFEIPSIGADVASRRSDLARADARLEAAKSAAARAERLLARGIAARREVEEAQRELAEDEASRSEAQASLQASLLLQQRATVKAPFAGVIARRWHNPGDLVEPSSTDPILRLIDPSRLEVEISVPVSELNRIEVGGSAQVFGPGGGEPEQAEVRHGAAAVDPSTSLTVMRLSFAGPTRLPAGTPVQVTVLGQSHRDAVLVPDAAVVREGADSLVLTVDAENHARRRKVVVGLTGGGDSEILEGLRAGEMVIVEGQEALPDGATVTTSGT